MKRADLLLLLLVSFILCTVTTHAQNKTIDSLKLLLQSQHGDTATVNSLNKLAASFLKPGDCDPALQYSNQAVQLADELKYKPGRAMARYYYGLSLRCTEDYAKAYSVLIESKNLFLELNNELYVAKCLLYIGVLFQRQDNSTDALENFFSALSVSEGIRDTTESMRALHEIIMIFYHNEKYEKALEYARKYETYAYGQDRLHPRDIITQQLGYIYSAMKNDSLSLHYQLESLRLSELQKDTFGIANSYMDLGDLLAKAKKYDQSIAYHVKAETMYRVIHDTNGIEWSFFKRARIYLLENKTDSALQSYAESLRLAKLLKDTSDIADNYLDIGRAHFRTSQYAKARDYYQLFLSLSKQLKSPGRMSDAYENLSQVNEKLHKPEEALSNLKMFLELKDSLEQKSETANLIAIEAKRNFERVVQENKMQQENERLVSRNKIYMLLTGLGFLFVLAILLYRNNRQKQKARTKIERAFEELKLTQSQLIHSEKMASLGELTAGIAHEIQNPLNFVNNFSEVSNDLIDEMMLEVKQGNYEDANAIANDVKQNLGKILHHGKRADGIVKGMLQHSRSSSGTKEPTDINALADEYLRLAYHGLRAKDKSFNAILNTDFDRSIGTINVIPQDIGRVILNLITNAFYAVTDQKKLGGDAYEPVVSVTTKKAGHNVEIIVKDNGPGIPRNIIDKIFQPFFTTKPTGQGTGLGLSVSYDIVKAHGGEIKVKTNSGNGTEFIILLPVA